MATERTLYSRRAWLASAGAVTSARAAAPVKIAFIGVGARGSALLRVLLGFPEVEASAICDIDERALERAQQAVMKARGVRPEGFSKGPEDYRRMLAREDFRAVLIATPQTLHARMSIDAMRAGKFAACEVPACVELEECRELVRTARQTRAGYMLLENYRYSRHAMQVANMAAKGAFGELTYAECGYIHETRALRFHPDGSLTWRGENSLNHIGDLYPTHSLGPVCGWMGINRTDRLASLVTLASRPASLHAYAVARYGAESPQARLAFRNGDTNNSLIRTAQGRLIAVRYDAVSARPHAMGESSLQGTKGVYAAAFGQHNVYLEGRTPAGQWEPLERLRAEYDHPYWKERGALAGKTGHGGGDYFVLSDMLDAIRGGASPIDAVDAATWSSIRPLSGESLRRGGAPVEIPDFSRA
jgi:predicted dehydrogenase